MSKYLCAKYYQGNVKRLQKRHMKDIKIYPKKKKKKRDNMGVMDIKTSLKMKSRGW